MSTQVEKDKMLSEAVKAAARILIEAVQASGYENPEMEVECKVSDGRVFQLKFERIDED